MKILVIGGSYFYGRVFLMLAAKEHEITVVNRGTYSLSQFGVKELRGDRHDAGLWQRCGEKYDVLVDFCAYEQGDIETVLRNLAGSVGQYILISTVDVYRRGTGQLKSENAPLEDRCFEGEAGAYIAGKVALEEELQRECGLRKLAYTSLRPGILYGPFNYAPRESVYIQMMVQQGVLPVVTDADGRFQFVYVKDAAEAVMKCLLNERAYGQAYNLCQDEIADYRLFSESLKNAADVEYKELPVTVEQAYDQRLPLPFPVTAAETELCDNEKGKRELGLTYTPFFEGMGKAYRAFKGVYAVR